MPGAWRQRERGTAPAWVKQPVIYPVCTKIAASVFPASDSSLVILSIGSEILDCAALAQAALTRSTARRSPIALRIAARLLSAGFPPSDRVR
jgi:hypothetical protein